MLPLNNFERRRFKKRQLGTGAGHIPNILMAQDPAAKVVSVDIDEKIVKAAHKYFDLPETHRPVITDARRFLHNSKELFYTIYLDVNNEGFTVPEHLTTFEFYTLAAAHLRPEGRLVMNMISPVEGTRSRILWATVKTIRAVFPQIRIYRGAVNNDFSVAQNILLVASFNPIGPRQPESLSEIPQEKVEALSRSQPIITDEFAPLPIWAAIDR